MIQRIRIRFVKRRVAYDAEWKNSLNSLKGMAKKKDTALLNLTKRLKVLEAQEEASRGKMKLEKQV